MRRFHVVFFVFSLEGINIKSKWSEKFGFKNSTQKNLFPIINLVILYYKINFIVFVPTPICCAKYLVWSLLLHPKKAIAIQKPLKRPLASSKYENWNSIQKDLLYVAKYIIQCSQIDFYLIVPTTICQIPFTPPNCIPRKAIASLSMSKLPLASLEKEKRKFYTKGPVLYG